jgi:hypothetical protein
MENIIQQNAAEVTEIHKNKVKSEAQVQAKSEFWELAEFNRYGIVPWLLVFVVSVGAGTAALEYHSDWKLFIIVISTIIVEVNALALTSMKSIVISSIISVTLNILMVFI